MDTNQVTQPTGESACLRRGTKWRDWQAKHTDRNHCACKFAGSGDPAHSGLL